ncbi:MAG: adaptor protein MecA [Oscillospiraceae bacterium]|nr:adaptor protein MecA [Oscillospiraceae bacterium]
MTFILLDSDRLKICLSQEEVHEHGFDEGGLNDRGIADLRGALVHLLGMARVRCGYSPRGAKILVEILPDENAGCVLCFTAVHGLRVTPGGCEIEPVVYAFPGACDMVRGIAQLYARYGHRIYKSSLYAGPGGFRLVVRALDYNDRSSGRFLEEYAHVAGSGEVFAAHIDEHYDLVIEDHAVDVIGKNLPPPASP